ncbi:divergent PAP2 family protein [Okeania sp.]|uniref:divergent PAP2 family protein n=1 Tax=Okeania sp. TaxID=3100323 RepID=UPI002B4AD968|nr:divergent PAP2 family protein [Okeania sp.]MEB3339722.1 divergent PAP2 family protein [Okeania sp.]
MENIGEIMNNHVLWVALLACFIAQFLKMVVELFQYRKINLKALFASGGMPSSHSAFVVALAVGVGQTEGWGSPEFALALVFAIIVMYDAAGVRQAAGLQAKILNQITDELFQEDHHLNQERLKELLGHTPVQVIAGFCLGVIVSWVGSFSY